MNKEELENMSLFNSDNLELNFDNDYFKNEDLDEDDQDQDEDIKKPVEEEDDKTPESVDGEDDDKDEGEDSDDDDSSPNLYSSFSNVLFEQGIIPSLESSEKIKSIDDLAEAIKKEIEIQADLKTNEKLESLDLEKIAISKKTEIELESIDEDFLKNNLEKAKDLILKDYLNQGLSEDRARKMLRKTIDLGEDVVIEEALESVQSLKVFEKKQQELELQNYEQRKQQELRQQEELNNTIKDFVFNSKEIIKGIPNTKVLQERVYKSMTEVVSKNPETGEMMNKFMSDRSKNPIAFDTKVYYLYELTNGFTDLGNIQKTVASKTIKDFESTLRKTKFEEDGVPNYLQDPDSYGGRFGSELVL